TLVAAGATVFVAATTGADAAAVPGTGVAAAPRAVAMKAPSVAGGIDAGFFGWGANRAGSVGDGTTAQRSQPTLYGGQNLVFKQVVAAKLFNGHTLALDTDGNVWA